MMETPVEVLRGLVEGQLLGVLGTQYRGAPYTSLVAFTAVEDLQTILFATARSTRKFRNLREEPRASMLIDNRDNTPGDFADAAAATAVGYCTELEGDERDHRATQLIGKHPQLISFVESPSCAVIAFKVEVYMLVQRFQEVVEIRPLQCS